MTAVRPMRPLPPVSVLRQTGWTLEVEVLGTSMAPLLRSGDRVTLCCQPPDALRPGDLICFQEGSEFILHRLLGRAGAGMPDCLEKGDALRIGRRIDPASVLGKAIRINGRPLSWWALRGSYWLSRCEHHLLRPLLPVMRRLRARREAWGR